MFGLHGVECVRTSVQVRPDVVDEEYCALLKKLNVFNIVMGCESGSQRVLDYMRNRTSNVQQNLDVVDMLLNKGIRVTCNIMLANPTETLEEMQMTYRFMEKVISKGAVCNLAVATPYPGTQYWDLALKKGTISDKMYRELNIGPGTPPRLLDDSVSMDEWNDIYGKAMQISKYTLSVDMSLNNLKAVARHPAYYVKRLYKYLRGVA